VTAECPFLRIMAQSGSVFNAKHNCNVSGIPRFRESTFTNFWQRKTRAKNLAPSAGVA